LRRDSIDIPRRSIAAQRPGTFYNQF
jgi:hypothetical protein